MSSSLTTRLPIVCSLGTRTARDNTNNRRVESLAAEFALLAQRRARVAHQIALLDNQRQAACATFDKIQARLAWLARGMDALDPQLRTSVCARPAEPDLLSAPRRIHEAVPDPAAAAFGFGMAAASRAAPALQPPPPAPAQRAPRPPRLSARPPSLPRPANGRRNG